MSPFEQYADRVGQKFTVSGKSTTEADDLDDVIEMDAVRFDDGLDTEAWAEEVCVGFENNGEESTDA